jgi:hypothetical protein
MSNFGLPQRGRTAEETVEHLFGHVSKISKELDFLLKNLDTGNFSKEITRIIKGTGIAARDMTFFNNGVIVSYIDGTKTKWAWHTDAQGRITLLQNKTEDFNIKITWNSGDLP